METKPADISTAQKAPSNKFNAGWRKWDKLAMAMLRPPGEAIMDHLVPRARPCCWISPRVPVSRD